MESDADTAYIDTGCTAPWKVRQTRLPKTVFSLFLPSLKPFQCRAATRPLCLEDSAAYVADVWSRTPLQKEVLVDSRTPQNAYASR